jgi:hypothetical protein
MYEDVNNLLDCRVILGSDKLLRTFARKRRKKENPGSETGKQ